ncbi:MAG: hypothetical protein WAS01_11290 [Nostocoides sp.]
MRLILPTLVLIGLLAGLVLLAQRGGRASVGAPDRQPLAGDPAGARAIQDSRPPQPPTPRQEAWRWTATVLGILVTSALVVLGIVLIVRSVWDL